MPLRVMESGIDVLTAARMRIKNAFSNGCKIYLSFSSGKDSLCMSSIAYDLIRAGEIDPKQLTVVFIDAEGLYRSMVSAAERWRRPFLAVGAELALPAIQAGIGHRPSFHDGKLDHLGTGEGGRMDPAAAALRDHAQPVSEISR